MHKKTWHNSAGHWKYPWCLSLQSVVLTNYHGLVFVQLLVGLTASKAASQPIAVIWMFNLEWAPETELMQEKGLCFSPVHFQKWLITGVKVMHQKHLMKCLRGTWQLETTKSVSAWKQVSFKFNKLSDILGWVGISLDSCSAVTAMSVPHAHIYIPANRFRNVGLLLGEVVCNPVTSFASSVWA